MVSVVDPDVVADSFQPNAPKVTRFAQTPSKTYETSKFKKPPRERQSRANVINFVDGFFEGDKEAQDAATCALHSMRTEEN